MKKRVRKNVRSVKAGLVTGMILSAPKKQPRGSRAVGEDVVAVMTAAERSGLLDDKSSRIAGRVSGELVEQAKRRTGIETDTDLIAFALANVALEDNFAEVFKALRGTVDPSLKLGY